MKYKRCNLEKLPDAVYEYETTKQTHKEICQKYDIDINSFFYNLKKSRTAQTQTTQNKYNNSIKHNRVSFLYKFLAFCS